MQEDRRRLVRAVLDGESVDRVPVGFWWHHYRVPAHIQLLQRHIKGRSAIPPELIWRLLPDNPFRGHVSDRILRNNIDGHKRDFLAGRPDLIKIMSDGFFTHPSILEHNISRPDRLDRIRPLGRDHPWIRRQVALVRELTDFYDGQVMAFYNVFAPIQQFRLFTEYVVKDVEGFQDMLRDHPEQVAAAAEVVAEDTVALVEALHAETGVDGIFYSVQSAQRPQCDRAHHDRFIKPSDLHVLERINQLWEHNVLHVCGYEHYQNDLGYYARYPASAYNWAVHTEGVDLARGKEIFDGVVLGGFDNNPGALLQHATSAELVSATGDLIRAAGADRLILGADCTIPAEVGHDRLQLIRYAAAEASSLK